MFSLSLSKANESFFPLDAKSEVAFLVRDV
jgi:hypothetical protein